MDEALLPHGPDDPYQRFPYLMVIGFERDPGPDIDSKIEALGGGGYPLPPCVGLRG